MNRRPRFIVFALLLIVSAFSTYYSSRVTMAASPQEVGVSTGGQNAWEFIGRLDQNGADLTGHGYLTYISGLPDDQLFSDQINRGEATAHFTYAASAKPTARSVLDTLIVVNATGIFNIYYNDIPKGNFKDLTTFSTGKLIATSSIRLQNVLNVQAPNIGISIGIAEFTQTKADSFTLTGKDYQLGHPGLVERLNFTGEATRSQVTLPISSTTGAGYAIVTDKGS